MRPDGWDEQRLLDTIIDKLDDYDRVLVEAGADAYEEALGKTGYRIKVGESFGDEETGARTIVKVDGRVVFIED